MLPLELDSQAEKNRKEKSKDTEKQRKNADRAEIREAKPQKKRNNSHQFALHSSSEVETQKSRHPKNERDFLTYRARHRDIYKPNHLI